MIVDRRKDSYDELLILARDARISRQRTTRWTTGLVIGGMLGASAYVASMNQQVSELSQVQQQHDAMRTELAELIEARNVLKVERDVIRDQFTKIVPASMVGDQIKNLGGLVDPKDADGDDDDRDSWKMALANVVWVVDGSRRFPMTGGDVLWIPEGKFWVRLEEADKPGELPTKATVHQGPKPLGPDAGDPIRDLSKGQTTEISVDAGDATRGVANCIRLTLHPKSLRPGFDGYVDMEVLYYLNDDKTCKP